MEKITDLQLCGCVLLKYALVNGQNEVLPELLRIIVIEMDMNYELVLSVMRDIEVTENNKSFIYTGELEKKVKKMNSLRGIRFK